MDPECSEKLNEFKTGVSLKCCNTLAFDLKVIGKILFDFCLRACNLLNHFEGDNVEF